MSFGSDTVFGTSSCCMGEIDPFVLLEKFSWTLKGKIIFVEVKSVSLFFAHYSVKAFMWFECLWTQ